MNLTLADLRAMEESYEAIICKKTGEWWKVRKVANGTVYLENYCFVSGLTAISRRHETLEQINENYRLKE